MNDGGPAFPTYEYRQGQMMPVGGMTLRDYFAAKAMQAYVSRDNWMPSALKKLDSADTDSAFDNLLSRYAYEMADAMLKARTA